ncbi:MAG: class I tRNA ligase family protein, partial [Candidatus Liptonbacteria bacterium]|nr:class I tRNA ligase family protein [Candidatus Liptonbacteria bacterium]
KTMQRNWIGRSEGATLSFSVKGTDEAIEVFTTRPDTLFGATYVVLAPEHPMVQNLKSQITNYKEVEAYVKAAAKKSEIERTAETKDKTGVELKGVKAVNPANKEEIPIWVSDFVLARYGTGAIMAVPAHDERDHEFAKEFNLPIKAVIEPETGTIAPNEQTRKSIVAIVEDQKAKKFLTLNWGPKLGGTLFIGGGREEGEDEVATALREIKEETGYANLKFVEKTERMHHHYFAFSKNVARNIEVVGLHFVLEGNEQGEKDLQHDEKNNFEVEWLTKDEVLRKVEDENHLLNFKRLVLGEVYTGRGLMANSGTFDGMPSEEATWKIAEFADGKRQVQYRLRDWLISRQRYWGTPIPVIYCADCGIQAVPEGELPVLLPDLEDFRPSEDGRSPLARA